MRRISCRPTSALHRRSGCARSYATLRPDVRRILPDQRAFSIHNILTPNRCGELISLSENIGYIEAPVNMGKTYGDQMRKDIRNNERVLYTNHELAEDLWRDLRPLLPTAIEGRTVVGLNEQFRFYKYNKGHRFLRHRDGTIELPDGRKSFYTVLYYLNDGFDGGSTILYENVDGERRGYPVQPTKASALVFRHSMLHEGEEVRSGAKYVLRSDVFYKL